MTFSVQDPSTDTLAVGLDGRPFRTAGGRPPLPPGRARRPPREPRRARRRRRLRQEHRQRRPRRAQGADAPLEEAPRRAAPRGREAGPAPRRAPRRAATRRRRTRRSRYLRETFGDATAEADTLPPARARGVGRGPASPGRSASAASCGTRASPAAGRSGCAAATAPLAADRRERRGGPRRPGAEGDLGLRNPLQPGRPRRLAPRRRGAPVGPRRASSTTRPSSSRGSRTAASSSSRSSGPASGTARWPSGTRSSSRCRSRRSRPVKSVLDLLRPEHRPDPESSGASAWRGRGGAPEEPLLPAPLVGRAGIAERRVEGAAREARRR